MKHATNSAILAFSLGLASQAAHADIIAGDLVLGFTSPTATYDYVVDLGAPSTSTTTISHLGSLIDPNQFSTAFLHGISDVSALGVGFGVGTAHTGDYAGLSILRTGNPDAGVAGTEIVPNKPSSGGNVTSAATAINSTKLGNPSTSDTLSFTYEATKLNSGTFANNLGTSQLASLSGTSIALDLFKSSRLATQGLSTPSSAYSYIGQLDIDFTGSQPVIDFIAAGYTQVPEPTTYGLFAGAGLLLVLRRRLTGLNA